MKDNSLLTLEDAVKVCMDLLHETTYFDDMTKEEYDDMTEFIKDKFEQKCWISDHKDNKPLRRLYDLIFDINPAEIASQITSDNLTNWCLIMQVEMNMAMVQLPLKDSASANPSNVIQIKDAVNVALEYMRQVDDESGVVVYDDYDEANETLTRWMQETAKIKSE